MSCLQAVQRYSRISVRMSFFLSIGMKNYLSTFKKCIYGRSKTTTLARTGKQGTGRVSIGNFIDNVLEHHLNSYKEVISSLYREEADKGIINPPKGNQA